MKHMWKWDDDSDDDDDVERQEEDRAWSTTKTWATKVAKISERENVGDKTMQNNEQICKN